MKQLWQRICAFNKRTRKYHGEIMRVQSGLGLICITFWMLPVYGHVEYQEFFNGITTMRELQHQPYSGIMLLCFTGVIPLVGLWLAAVPTGKFLYFMFKKRPIFSSRKTS